MKKFLIVLFIICFMMACTLTASQEKKLNESLTTYINARNKCLTVSEVAFTHPELVKYYQSKGDSIFKAEFDCANDTVFLKDPMISQTKKVNSEIHMEYILDIYSLNTGEIANEKHHLYAISIDDGNSWFFMDKTNYVDKSILPNFKRLLKN